VAAAYDKQKASAHREGRGTKRETKRLLIASMPLHPAERVEADLDAGGVLPGPGESAIPVSTEYW
jgi:hypothetical protein